MWMCRVRPLRDRVQRARIGQPWHFAPKVAVRERVIVTVTEFGQDAVIASRSIVKSSIVNPSAIVACNAIGLIVAV